MVQVEYLIWLLERVHAGSIEARRITGADTLAWARFVSFIHEVTRSNTKKSYATFVFFAVKDRPSFLDTAEGIDQPTEEMLHVPHQCKHNMLDKGLFLCRCGDADEVYGID